jgi:hypothetical protein
MMNVVMEISVRDVVTPEILPASLHGLFPR